MYIVSLDENDRQSGDSYVCKKGINTKPNPANYLDEWSSDITRMDEGFHLRNLKRKRDPNDLYTQWDHMSNLYFRFAIIPANARVKSEWISYDVILGDRYNLCDIKIIKLLIKNNIEINESFIRLISTSGYPDLVSNVLRALRFLKDNGYIDKCPDHMIDIISNNGMVEILEWWLNESEVPLIYTKFSMDFRQNFSNIDQKRFIDVLDWWFKSGLELKYSEECFYYAIMNGFIDVLKWWKNSKLPVKNNFLLNLASMYGHVDILNWLVSESAFSLKYTVCAMDSASDEGHVAVLDWWLKSGFKLKYSKRSLDSASASGHVAVLDWWVNSGLPLRYSKQSLNQASYNGHINVLEWWKKSGLHMKYSKRANTTKGYGRGFYVVSDNVLQWWIDNGFSIKSSTV
jgi:hypothetical protein